MWFGSLQRLIMVQHQLSKSFLAWIHSCTMLVITIWTPPIVMLLLCVNTCKHDKTNTFLRESCAGFGSEFCGNCALSRVDSLSWEGFTELLGWRRNQRKGCLLFSAMLAWLPTMTRFSKQSHYTHVLSKQMPLCGWDDHLTGKKHVMKNEYYSNSQEGLPRTHSFCEWHGMTRQELKEAMATNTDLI